VGGGAHHCHTRCDELSALPQVQRSATQRSTTKSARVLSARLCSESKLVGGCGSNGHVTLYVGSLAATTAIFWLLLSTAVAGHRCSGCARGLLLQALKTGLAGTGWPTTSAPWSEQHAAHEVYCQHEGSSKAHELVASVALTFCTAVLPAASSLET
jgi:hypothetical protein